MRCTELQEATFVHNAQLYRLTARRCADASAASRLAAKRLAAHSARVEELTGTIADLMAGGSTAFRLWFDPEDPTGLPLSFECRPRSFLRLAFEWDRPGKGSSPVSPLFNKEDV